MPGFSEEELEAFAREHVAYEVWACANGVARWYMSRGSITAVARSELLVAQLVHLRSLDEFLTPAPRFPDDVRAEHYAPSWICPPSALDEHRDWVNGQVAHFAMRRKSRPIWNPVELTRDVLDTFSDFLTELSSTAESYFEPTKTVLAGFASWYRLVMAEVSRNAPEPITRPDTDISRFEFGWASPYEISSS